MSSDELDEELLAEFKALKEADAQALEEAEPRTMPSSSRWTNERGSVAKLRVCV